MPELSVDELEQGVIGSQRSMLARAITLAESEKQQHVDRAQELLTRLLPRTGGAVRIGITGTPGAGKSTFIDELGTRLVADGHRVAVLAIDPSSVVSGGSILGDKTRMTRLSREANAFVRPSPTSGRLGGVANKTREAMLLCEAAGFDVVLVETVGVGQSETVVGDVVDLFVALMISGAGDQLQGIKRGVLEVADAIVINKADGDNVDKAKRSASELRMALHLMRGSEAPPVFTCSAVEGTGVEELWSALSEIWTEQSNSGRLNERRREQDVRWMWRLIDEGLRLAVRSDQRVGTMVNELESKIRLGRASATAAAHEVLNAMFGEESNHG